MIDFSIFTVQRYATLSGSIKFGWTSGVLFVNFRRDAD